MNYASLFSGVGGFETALNNEGFTCVFASEIDKHANTAYEVLYKHKTAGDITKVDALNIPDHDILTAGFPCQAFSVAGNRKGFDDTRGTLFFEVARIAAEKKPRYILLENVKGLVSHDKGKTLDTIVTTLNIIGYTVDFEVLNSKYFGVPQNRERIFIVGVLHGLMEDWNVEKRTDVVAKGKRRIAKIDGVKTFNFDWPKQTAVTSRLRDVLEENVDEKYYLSEEKTAKLVAQLETKHQPDSENPEMLGLVEGINGHEQRKRVYSVYGICPTPSGLGIGGNTEPKIAEPQIDVVGMLAMKGNDAVRRVYAPTGISPTLTTMGGGNREPKIFEVRPVLTPDIVNKTQNGRRFKEDGEESFTLTVRDRHDIAIGKFPKYRIRKLTPLECFRLQGFSDESFYKLKYYSIEEAKNLLDKQKGKHNKRAIPHETRIERISDSQLYKMAGNAVTVNVITAIAKQLKKLAEVFK